MLGGVHAFQHFSFSCQPAASGAAHLQCTAICNYVGSNCFDPCFRQLDLHKLCLLVNCGATGGQEGEGHMQGQGCTCTAMAWLAVDSKQECCSEKRQLGLCHVCTFA